MPGPLLGGESGAELGQLGRPACVGGVGAEEILDGATGRYHGRRNARYCPTPALDDERLPGALDLVEQVGEVSCRFCCRVAVSRRMLVQII